MMPHIWLLSLFTYQRLMSSWSSPRFLIGILSKVLLKSKWIMLKAVPFCNQPSHSLPLQMKKKQNIFIFYPRYLFTLRPFWTLRTFLAWQVTWVIIPGCLTLTELKVQRQLQQPLRKFLGEKGEIRQEETASCV